MLKTVSLADKYDLSVGRVFITGIQALARLPILQHERDKRAGLDTGTYISGYRGSPVGGLDTTLEKMGSRLSDNKIVFQPGLNEESSIVAVWGSQQSDIYKDATVDGVVGMWYAKGVGIARGQDALKHANIAGTSRTGGVLAIVGDDHGCQSSAIPHQSDQELASAMIPILAPSNIQEIVDFGQIGIAMSRFSGCWTALKVTVETVEIAGTVEIDPACLTIVEPTDFAMPAEGLGIRWPDPALDGEKRLHGPKMEAVQAFARANRVDRTIYDSSKARIGIVASGKAFQDLQQALEELGIGSQEAEALGLRVYKVGLVWPLERAGALAFAEGLDEIMIVEEKRAFIEEQFARLLFERGGALPKLYGKLDASGQLSLPSFGQLDPAMVGGAVWQALERNGLTDRVPLRKPHQRNLHPANPSGEVPVRSPFFCSGCPHNRSTVVPEGSKAMGGTGCHAMAIWLPYRNTETLTQMGGEGLNWLGRAPFARTKHMFQNMGDGTYTHSGALAIRAAAASGANITYKILYNDAVAMTGGQKLPSQITVPQISRQVTAEGARRVVVVTDEPGKYGADADFAPNVQIRDRSDLDAVQRELRDIEGLTVLIYDQTCAAEKRRRRKRKEFPDPDRRVFINSDVCEGCGDCSAKSHCISVQPLETDLGRKRVIDQSNCNKDFSCLEGFCPSFVTVHGGRPRASAPVTTEGAVLPPAPRAPLDERWNALVTGIGGTGVITVGQIIGMAAHLEGLGCSVLDFTGLAQKNGAVTSHVRIAPTQEALHAVRVPRGSANLVLACDAVVAASPAAVTAMAQGVTHAVVNNDMAPVAAFVTQGDMDFGNDAVRAMITEAVGVGNLDLIDATRLATKLTGDSVSTNLFMLGFACQKGLVPLSREALEEAIRINGVAVQRNLDAFWWGRRAAVDLAAVESAAAEDRPALSNRFEDVLDRRVAFLTRYQDADYGNRLKSLAEAALAAERRVAPNSDRLAHAVTETMFRLMAYKDEYEVARLYSDPRFRENLQKQFDGDYKLSFHLAPPLLAKRDARTGHLQKKTYGGWMLKVFAILAKGRKLRGTMFDPFGYTAERRMERRLIDEQEALITSLLTGLTADNFAATLDVVLAPQAIKGYGHVKEANFERFEERQAELLAALKAGKRVRSETISLVAPVG